MIPWDEFWTGVAQSAIVFGLVLVVVALISGLGLLLANWMRR